MRFKLNEAKMFADIADGMAIVINSSTGVYYGMNSFGTTLFDNLVSGSSVEEILTSVKDIPEASGNLEKNVTDFVSTLVKYEIIIPVDEGTQRSAVIDPATVLADAFVPECKEYKDVQELLFADPIHDVEEDKGWSPK